MGQRRVRRKRSKEREERKIGEDGKIEPTFLCIFLIARNFDCRLITAFSVIILGCSRAGRADTW